MRKTDKTPAQWSLHSSGGRRNRTISKPWHRDNEKCQAAGKRIEEQSWQGRAKFINRVPRDSFLLIWIVERNKTCRGAWQRSMYGQRAKPMPGGKTRSHCGWRAESRALEREKTGDRCESERVPWRSREGFHPLL